MIDAARARGITIDRRRLRCHRSSRRLYLDRGADVVVAGEGEVTLVEVLDALTGSDGAGAARDDRRPLPARRRTAASSRRRRATIIRDLDALPFPAWDLVDVERYRAIWRARHGYFSMNMVTTRGCPYHCNWCAKPIYGQRYTARSPEHVVDEMAWLKRDLPARPPLDRRRHLRPQAGLDRALRGAASQARDAAIPFKCLLRADQVDGRRRRGRCARAGCQTAWIGAESGSQRILDAMEKGTRVEQIVDGDAAAARRRHRGRLLPAVRLSRRDARRHRSHAARWCATARRTTSACRCRIRCRARTFYRARAGAAWPEAELGRLERPGDDVPRDLRARISTARCMRWCTPSSGRGKSTASLARALRGRGRCGGVMRAPRSTSPTRRAGVAAAAASEPAGAADRAGAADAADPAADAAGGRRADRSVRR